MKPKIVNVNSNDTIEEIYNHRILLKFKKVGTKLSPIYLIAEDGRIYLEQYEDGKLIEKKYVAFISGGAENDKK